MRINTNTILFYITENFINALLELILLNLILYLKINMDYNTLYVYTLL